MPHKVQVKRPASIGRIAKGAWLVAGGILLLWSGSELPGIVAILTGFAVGIRGVAQPLFFVLYNAVFVGLFLLFWFWISYDSDRQSLDAWFAENWYFFIAIAIPPIVGAVLFFVRQDSIWDALYEDFSDFPDWISAQDLSDGSHRMADGLLQFADDEFFDISTIGTKDGIVLSRNDGDSLFFPWTRVSEIRHLDVDHTRAWVDIKRKTPLPLRLDIPWSPHFDKEMPPDIKVAGGQ